MNRFFRHGQVLAAEYRCTVLKQSELLLIFIDGYAAVPGLAIIYWFAFGGGE